MKKSFRKLIPTFVMLVITAALVGTSTFAWFSMNTTVTVTGMQVDIKSNNTYLLVNTGANDTADEIQSAGVTTVPLTVTDLESRVYPSSPILDAYVADNGDPVNNAAHKYFLYGTDVVEDYTTAAVAANWFTAQNNNPGNANDSVKNVTTLTAGDFSDYVIKRTAYLTVADGADAANNLTVTTNIYSKALGLETATGTAVASKTYYTYSAGVYTKVDPATIEVGVTDVSGKFVKDTETGDSNIDLTAVKVLVATDDGGFAILSYANNGTPVDIKGSNTSLTDADVLTVDIYIYYDGEVSSVYTNNIENLSAAAIELAFNVSVA